MTSYTHNVLTRRMNAPTRSPRAVLDVDRRRTWRQSSRADERRPTDGGAHTAGQERNGEGLAATQSRSLPPQGQRPAL